jgi:hypothetical protein
VTVVAVSGWGQQAVVEALEDFCGVALGLDPATTAKLVDKITGMPSMGLFFAAFILGNLIGYILLGLAMWRGKIGPVWSAWLLVAAGPLQVVGHIAGTKPVLAAIELVTVAGLSGIAGFIIRDGIGWSRSGE